MNQKLFVISVILVFCLIFTSLAAAKATETNVTKNVTAQQPVTQVTKNVTAQQPVAQVTKNVTAQKPVTQVTKNVTTQKPVTQVTKNVTAQKPETPTVTSINPTSGKLGEKMSFNITGSHFQKSATVYLSTEVKNKTKTIEGKSIQVKSDSQISGVFKLPTNVPNGTWNLTVEQSGLKSSSKIPFTLI